MIATSGTVPWRPIERYVAIGDSSTEGIDDPDGAGGYRGWANRLAERIAAVQGSLLYANLGVRGRVTREVHDQQLAPARALRPDFATVFAGSNDLLRRRFDALAIERDVADMQRSLIAGGARVVTFTFPDLVPIMPLARVFNHRVHALNAALRNASRSTGAVLVDFALHDVGSDARLWSEDRFHANAAGHERIAAAIAHAIGLPGSDDSWMRPLPAAHPVTTGERLEHEFRWLWRHVVAAAWIGWTGPPREIPRPKRPRLEPV
jgi:lysophospholipase L1-like esterase